MSTKKIEKKINKIEFIRDPNPQTPLQRDMVKLVEKVNEIIDKLNSIDDHHHRRIK